MARLSFDCQDADGNRVTIHTSEGELKELIAHYPELKKSLAVAGFTLTKAYRRKREKIAFDGQHCPKCGKPMWDNRTKKQNGEYSSKAPDFKCSDKECGNALWPGAYEVVAPKTNP